MKKTVKIMAMVLFVTCLSALTSCQKDYESQIIGKWEFKSMDASFGGQTFSMDVNEMVEMYGVTFDSDELIIEFKNNGYVYADGDGVPYSIRGNEVTITTEDQSFSFKIKELTGNKMTWEYTDKELNMEIVISLRRV